MNTIAVGTPMDSWRAFTIGPGLFVAAYTLSLGVYGVGMLQSSIGSEFLVGWNGEKLMNCRLSFVPSILTWAVLFINKVLVKDQGVRQELTEAKHAGVACIKEEIVSQKDVHLTDCKQESHHSAGPSSSSPYYFQGNRRMALGIMIVNSMAVMVVVVDDFWVPEGRLMMVVAN